MKTLNFDLNPNASEMRCTHEEVLGLQRVRYDTVIVVLAVHSAMHVAMSFVAMSFVGWLFVDRVSS